MDIVCGLSCIGVSFLWSSGITNCCSVDFGFAMFLPFMFPVLIAFLCCMHFIESTMRLFQMLRCEMLL